MVVMGVDFRSLAALRGRALEVLLEGGIILLGGGEIAGLQIARELGEGLRNRIAALVAGLG